MALLAIEHHREDDALILPSGTRCGNKHRLSWITPVFVPGAGCPRADIDFDELIVPVISVEPVQVIRVRLVEPDAVGELVVSAIIVLIVDAGQFNTCCDQIAN